MLRDIIGQRHESIENGKPVRTKSAVAAFESVDSSSMDNIVDSSFGADAEASSELETGGNYLANDVTIKGAIRCAGDFFVDGEVEGEVHVNGHLAVGKTACITGEVRAKSTVIYGQIAGNITAGERCELKASATVKGDIAARSISIEEGASFFGKSAVGASQEMSERPTD